MWANTATLYWTTLDHNWARSIDMNNTTNCDSQVMLKFSFFNNTFSVQLKYVRTRACFKTKANNHAIYYKWIYG